MVDVGVHFDFVKGFIDADGPVGGGAGEGWTVSGVLGELFEVGEERGGAGVGSGVSSGLSAAEEEEDGDCTKNAEES